MGNVLRPWYEEDPPFYCFICYNSDVYNKYQGMVEATFKLTQINKSSKNVKAIEDELNQILQDEGILNQFELAVKAARKLKNMRGIFQTVTPKYTVEQILNIIDANQLNKSNKQAMMDAINIIIKNITQENKNINEQLQGNLNVFIGTVGEKLLEEAVSKQLGQLINSIKTVGDVRYGHQSSILSKALGITNKKIYVKDIITGKILDYNGKQMKVDSVIKGANEDYTIGVKAHWSKNKRSSVQGTPLSLRHILSLATTYGIGIDRTQVGYWKFLNDLYWGGDYNKEALYDLIYAAYFGNVDFEIDWQLYYNNPKVRVIPAEKIKKYLKDKVNLILGFQPQFLETHTKDTISNNEQIVLNSIMINKLIINFNNIK